MILYIICRRTLFKGEKLPTKLRFVGFPKYADELKVGKIRPTTDEFADFFYSSPKSKLDNITDNIVY